MTNRIYNHHLSDVQWKEFKVGSLFESIQKGKCTNEAKQTKYSDKGVSYLSATNVNNGVSNFVERTDLTQKGNCIMFVNRGDGGAGYSVYKREDFIATASTSFGYAKWINEDTGLFVSTILSKLKKKYSFGYGRTKNRLLNDKIMLPVDNNGNPNFHFMEEYIKERKTLTKSKLIQFFERERDRLIIHPHNLPKVQWKDFFIGGKQGIFKMSATKSGIDKNKLNLEKGDIPYITNTGLNNSISLFVSDNQNKKYNKNKRNVITIGGPTQTCFYQESDFYTGRNVQILTHEKLNRKIAMFVIPLIKNQIKKLSWSNGATLSRLKQIKILLPVDEESNINWDYMEKFSENIQLKQINDVQKFLREQS